MSIVCLVLSLFLVARTLCMMCMQWRRKKTVPAWMEWMLIMQVALSVMPWLHGAMVIPALALAVVGLVGIARAMHQENRHMNLEIARMKEEHYQFVETYVRRHAEEQRILCEQEAQHG